MEEKKLKVAIYIRVANKEEVVEDSLIEKQKRIANEAIKGLKVESKKIYVDNGFTGRNFKRPAYKEMIKDIQRGERNLVLVSEISRLSRNSDVIETIDKLNKKYNVDFISGDNYINTLTKKNEYEMIKVFRDFVRQEMRRRYINSRVNKNGRA